MKQSSSSFLMLRQWNEQIAMLSLEQKGRLLDAIYNYQCSGKSFSSDDGVLNMLWASMKQTFDYNMEKYEKICSENRINAKKRWKNTDKNVCDRMRSHASASYNDNDIDNDNEIDNDIEKENEFDNGVTSSSLLKKHQKEYDFSAYSKQELTETVPFGYDAGFTLAEADMLRKLIYEKPLQRYLIKINDYDSSDKFRTIIQWAKEDEEYRGLKYELNR